MNVIIITGPSATGKTKLALTYAKKKKGELVNFDSRQIYKYLDIITGKDIPDSPNLPNTFPKIWLYDLVDPKTYFSSFDFVKEAIKTIEDIIKRGKTPILVGGTYLYLYHLLYNVETEHIAPNPILRKKLNKHNVPELQSNLKKIDALLFESLNTSDKQNPQRLIRKIEIATYYKKTGKKVPTKMKYIFNEFFKNKKIEFIGLTYQKREELLHAIKQRVEKRIKQGAFEEVKQLLKNGYNENDPGLKTIGYQQIISFLKGKTTKQKAIDLWILKEFQYTKRQLTFMKKDPNIIWQTI